MSESDAEASFESADEGGENEASEQVAAGVAKMSTSNESYKLQADVANTEKAAAGKVSPKAVGGKESVETAGAESTEPRRATTPTRKAHRIVDTDKTDKAEEKTEDAEKNVLEKMAESAKAKNWGWGSISSWGTSVLNTASTSVHTFADNVGEGFQNVLETVEFGLGVPDPELLAEEKKQQSEEKEEADVKTVSSSNSGSSLATSSESGGPDTPVSDPGTPTAPVQSQPQGRDKAEVIPPGSPGEGQAAPGEEEKDGGWFEAWGIGGITTAVQQTVKKTVKDTTQAFQETGKTLVTGSLDVLETIGKKTYDVLAEGDHGLKKTIKKTKDKPNLSQLLREAKDKAAEHSKEEEEFAETRKAHYGAQFDEFQGLVQLEALEMLSNQCEARVQGLLGTLKVPPGQDTINKELHLMKETFELKDFDEEEDDDDEDRDHDFDRLMADYIGQVGLNITPEKLINVQEKTRKLLMDCRVELDDGTQKEPKELHQQAIQSLAEFTARSIELFHRVGQLVLLEKNAPLTSYRTKANSLASATRVLCTEIGISSAKFTRYLGTVANSIDNPVSVNPLITNVFLEASNSSTYIQDGFILLLPVLQQGAIEAYQRSLTAGT